MDSGQEVSFELAGDTLKVRGILGLNDEDRFAAALRQLRQTEFPTVVIDMGEVTSINSRCLRHVMLVLSWLRQRDRQALVRARQQTCRLLTRMGGDALGAIELVEG